MRHPHDRRDLACFGLTVLVYGLVVAPVLHAAVDHAGGLELPTGAQAWLAHQRPQAHEHGHDHGGAGHGHEHEPAHEHGKGHPHRHLWGSVEHLQAVAMSSVVVLAPMVGWVPLRAEGFHRPEWAPVAPLRLTAMPQGP
jgi:ABC-type nickel/cobalt efflux system permease component RcnA